MTKNKWKKLILEQMSALGVQKDAYDSAVETLAQGNAHMRKSMAGFHLSFTQITDMGSMLIAETK